MELLVVLLLEVSPDCKPMEYEGASEIAEELGAVRNCELVLDAGEG